MGQMSLGALIEALEAVGEDDRSVVYDFPSTCPTYIASWRGSYDEPALGWAGFSYSGDAKPPSVYELITRLRLSIDRPYEGWKGGTYHYGPSSLLWVDNPGNYSATYITEVDSDSGFYVVLKTERRDD